MAAKIEDAGSYPGGARAEAGAPAAPRSDILDRLGAALDRKPARDSLSLTPGTLEAKKQKRDLSVVVPMPMRAARGMPSLSSDGSPTAVQGLQQCSPSPQPKIAPFNLAPTEGWDPDIHSQAKQEVSQDMHSQFDRHASFDNSPNRSVSVSPPKSPSKSIHARRAEESVRQSLTPGSLAAQGQSLSANFPIMLQDSPNEAAPQYPKSGDAEISAGAPQRPARKRDSFSPGPAPPPRMSPPPFTVDAPSEQSRASPTAMIVDEIPMEIPKVLQEVDEVTMESLVLAENQAVQHVVVAGCGRQYMACLVTLKVEVGSENMLAPQALNFARANGSNATTVEEAKTCSAFHMAMLKAFAVCNKMVWETSKRMANSNGTQKPSQLRRYTILFEHFTAIDETLRPDGSVDRARVLELYAEVVESMYGAATTGTSDPVCVTPVHPAFGGSVRALDSGIASDVHSSPAAQKIPLPVDYPAGSNYNESESTQSTLDAQAAANGQHNAESDLHDNNLSPGERMASMTYNNIHANQLLSPAASLPRKDADADTYVLDKEPTPNFGVRMCSYFKTFLPCLGPHSQVLDDDILNPSHTIVKRAEPGRQSVKKKQDKDKGPSAASPAKAFDRGVFDATTEGYDEARSAGLSYTNYLWRGIFLD